MLATHQYQFIGDFRCMLMMSGGRILCDGSYSACISASGGFLTHALQNNEVIKDFSLKIPQTEKSDGEDIEKALAKLMIPYPPCNSVD